MLRRPRRPPDQTIGSHIGYRVDRFLGLHPLVQLAAVLSVAFVVALIFGAAIYFIDDSIGVAPDQQRRVEGVRHGLWWAITRMLDGGTVANDSGPLRQAFGLGVTLVGLVMVAVITGAFASSFSERLAAMRGGSLAVFERGHVVLLGWNTYAGVVVRELADSGLRATLVILADEERDVIEEALREQVEGRPHRLRFVVRRGDPSTAASARRAAVRQAHAILILPTAQPGGSVDRVAMRSVLAVQRALRGRARPVIVEVSTPGSRDLMRLCGGSGRVIVVEGQGVNARLLAQAMRQQGAFSVIRQILSLDGRSIFVHPAADFAGETFDDAHAAIDGGVLVGIVREGEPMLAPESGLVIAADDRLLVFAHDRAPPRATGALPPSGAAEARAVDRARASAGGRAHELSILVIRYRPELADILTFLDGRCPTRVVIMVPPEDAGRARAMLANITLTRTVVEVIEGDPLDGPAVDRALAVRRDVALLLAPDVTLAAAADADAEQLITLLHLRRAGDAAPRAVVELRSPETRHLARPIAGREAFLLKRETVGMLLAQELHAICLDRAGSWVGPVYAALLEVIAPSVELHPMVEYARGREDPTFADLMVSARACGQIAIGVAEQGASPQLLPDRKQRFDASTSRVVVLEARGRAPVSGNDAGSRLREPQAG